uniref:Reverse transcriptase zinc-binding domain-containing protein n=1 Tax=Quercus lobata TaxID=97700 RepID=A0A7N2MPY1_QUELO
MKRKIISEDLCEQCRKQKEDVVHALYHCQKLLDLWTKVDLWNHSSLQQTTSFIDLMGCVFADNRDPALFSMVAWAISWNQRNNLCLGKPAVSLGELLSQSKERLREFKLYNSSITPVG